MKDFIGRTECSEDIVKGLIEFFCDNEKHHKKGITGKAIGKDFEFAVHKQVKESIDLTCDLHQLHQYDVWKKGAERFIAFAENLTEADIDNLIKILNLRI